MSVTLSSVSLKGEDFLPLFLPSNIILSGILYPPIVNSGFGCASNPVIIPLTGVYRGRLSRLPSLLIIVWVWRISHNLPIL